MIRRTNRRMVLCITLLCLNLAFIWGNSLLPGSASGMLSQWVKDLLDQFFHFPSSAPDAGDGLLRKLAHFSEFAMLGALFCWLFAMLLSAGKRTVLLPGVSGFLAACADEIIQRFVPGRHGCFTDVCIDFAGVLTGIILFSVGYRIWKKRYAARSA